jgi:HEPN pEK499 p136
MEIVKFDREFVERTKEILISYRGNYELSNALNCLLGLLVLPFERMNVSSDGFWDTPIVNIPQLSVVRITYFEPIQSIDRQTGSATYYPKTFKNLGIYSRRLAAMC